MVMHMLIFGIFCTTWNNYYYILHSGGCMLTAFLWICIDQWEYII